MKKHLRNSAGFGHFAGLLILIIVGLVGFTGWYVWDKKKDSDRKASSVQDTANISSRCGDDQLCFINGNITFTMPKGWQKLKK